MERKPCKEVRCHEECNNCDISKGHLGLQCALVSHPSTVLSQLSILIQPNRIRSYFLIISGVVFIFFQTATPQCYTSYSLFKIFPATSNKSSNEVGLILPIGYVRAFPSGYLSMDLSYSTAHSMGSKTATSIFYPRQAFSRQLPCRAL